MPSFEEHLRSLESVVERLEKGDLPLEEAVTLFEEGIAMSEACRKELDAAEGRVQLLLKRANQREMEEEDLDIE